MMIFKRVLAQLFSSKLWSYARLVIISKQVERKKKEVEKIEKEIKENVSKSKKRLEIDR